MRGPLRRVPGLVRRVRAERTRLSFLGRNLVRSAGLVASRPSPVAYLGFARRGNAGDDAILLAHQRSLSGLEIGLLPLEWERETLSLLRHVRRRPLHRGILVGGGTLVGRPEWRRRLQV